MQMTSGWLGDPSPILMKKFQILISLLLAAGASAAPNVLFIAIDDLRNDLACYGDEIALTPNFDRLAAQGIVFNRAYCQLAVCGPSRHSLLSGLRPDTNRVWDLDSHFRETFPDRVSLPQHFKNNGYHTRSIGKIYHGSGIGMTDPPSWSVEAVHDYGRKHEWRYASAENRAVVALKRSSTEGEDVPDNTFVDGIVCEDAEDALDHYAKSKQPFFLAVGFRKPHLPFVAPKKYWDLYDRSEISEPITTTQPKGAPEYALRTWNEIEGYTDIPKELDRITPEQTQLLRHGYYACISYIDTLIGRLLDKLDALDLADNTIICLWSDHGFHLGEQGLWAKANNYELTARVPLIVSTPDQKSKGSNSDALVELVDVFPTLVELCGLDMPSGLEGWSFEPLLDNPALKWKTAAFHQYPRHYTKIKHKKHGDVMGYVVRTDNFRYVQWKDWKSGEILVEELYDQRADPNEMLNIAKNENQAATLFQHRRILEAGWKAALP